MDKKWNKIIATTIGFTLGGVVAYYLFDVSLSTSVSTPITLIIGSFVGYWYANK